MDFLGSALFVVVVWAWFAPQSFGFWLADIRIGMKIRERNHGWDEDE